MLKAALALALVASMYGLFLWGQARGAEAFLAEARATYADYEDALHYAQAQYDKMLSASNAHLAQLEMNLAIERDTLEYWRHEAEQAKAERDRWKSLAAFVSGQAY